MRQDLQPIKDKLDIIYLAERYGFEFKGTGNRLRAVVNLFRDEKTSSLDFFKDTQKFFDRGTGEGGDVIDMIKILDRLTPTQAIIKAKELAGADNDYQVNKVQREPLKKKVTKVDFKLLSAQSCNELKLVKNPIPFTLIDFIENDKVVKQEILLNDRFKKLFEGKIFPIEYKEKFTYIFENLLGWSDYWLAPSLILRNMDNIVADIVAYRPRDKETGEEIGSSMKYYYRNFKGRGFRFIYPYQIEVEKIAKREKYIIIGEGLKNALNGLLYGVPFLTLESTGNTLNLSKELLATIERYISLEYGVMTAFDGDESGRKAYETFLSLSGLEVDNILDFNSNIDFVEHLKAD